MQKNSRMRLHPGVAILITFAQQDFFAEEPVSCQIDDHVQLALVVEAVGGAGDHDQGGLAVEQVEELNVAQVDQLVLIALKV